MLGSTILQLQQDLADRRDRLAQEKLRARMYPDAEPQASAGSDTLRDQLTKLLTRGGTTIGLDPVTAQKAAEWGTFGTDLTVGGTALSADDMMNSLAAGNYGDAALDAISMVPVAGKWPVKVGRWGAGKIGKAWPLLEDVYREWSR